MRNVALPGIVLLILLELQSGAARAGMQRPLSVSPGSHSELVTVEARCPTFSWGSADDAESYELVVYPLLGREEKAKPLLRRYLPGSVNSWTPSLDQCMVRGASYAWAIRAHLDDTPSDWSSPMLFAVAIDSTAAESECRSVTVRSSMVQDEAPAETLGTELIDGNPAKPQEQPAASIPSAVATPYLVVDGGVAASSFSGDGSQLSNLGPEQLAPGSAAIDIDGTAANAETVDGIDSTGFMAAGADAWVDTAGDTMSGTLVLDPPSGDALQTTADIVLGGNLRMNGGGSIQVGHEATPCSTSGEEGIVRWTGTSLEVCTPRGWVALYRNRDGAWEANPGDSCKQIHVDYPSAPDGAYWIDPDGDGGAESKMVYCDMDGDGGGWTLCAALTKGYVPAAALYYGDWYGFQARLYGSENYVFERDAPARTPYSWDNSETLNYGTFCRAMPSVDETRLEAKLYDFANDYGASARGTPYDAEYSGIFDGNLFAQWMTNSSSPRSFAHTSGDPLYILSDDNGFGGPYTTPSISWTSDVLAYTQSTNSGGGAGGDCSGCTDNGPGYATLPYGQTTILNDLSHSFWSGIPRVHYGWSDCTANGSCSYHESGFGVWLFWVR